MKAYKFIMTCILALVGILPMQAQTVDREALYVYQNDGNVNIFFRNEVTSISIELKDGELYQVVKTGERQHAFPISNIQSVSFVNPAEDTYRPTIIEDEETPTFGKFVDLGLPSGTMWASFNVGASTPEEYGGYFAWGETEEKNVYRDDTYKYYQDGSYVSLGDDISGTEYDVAHVKWGGNWVMPTEGDIHELLDNCTSEWTTLNDVNGMKFTSKKNGNSIFLPATGWRLYDILLDAGSVGYYWLSTQYSGVCGYNFNSGDTYWSNFDHYFGQSVRPICRGLLISSNEVELTVGESKTVDIMSGSGYYTIENSDAEVATATINENAILINALNAGETTITVTDNQFGTTAIITVKVNSYVPSDAPEAIDLGLPSGTKWASCNVGATKPEEYGGYYAWGETEEKEIYNLSTYIHCDGSYETFHDLGSDISGTEYDVAHVKWGGDWCMPTLDDIIELLVNCTSEWTTLNDVNGMKFTSKTNGNSIFLPAAGFRWNGGLDGAGSYGLCWSSTQYPSYAIGAYYLTFDSGGADWDGSYRNNGQSVRPVARN
ncbi:MAG: hypothetical protein IKX24_03775 [Prevotella sp.]|nr:hypothetical protein [Prevotella sp.]